MDNTKLNKKKFLIAYFTAATILIVIHNVINYFYLSNFYFSVGNELMQFTTQAILTMGLKHTIISTIVIFIGYLGIEIIFYLRTKKEQL